MRPERFELPTYCSGGNRSIQTELRARSSCLQFTCVPGRDQLQQEGQWPSLNFLLRSHPERSRFSGGERDLTTKTAL